MTANHPVEFIKQLYARRNRPKFIIEPLNGLGNRVRALASGAVIAATLNYNLIINWIPDEHCQCKFGDLFVDTDFIVVSTHIKDDRVRYPVAVRSCDETEEQAVDSLLAKDEKEHKDIHIASASVIKCKETSWSLEKKWIRANLHPVHRIVCEVERYERFFAGGLPIGVHIRMGQDPKVSPFERTDGWDPEKKVALEANRKSSNYSYFMEEIEKIWRARPNQRFVLCADNPDIYLAFTKRYKSRIDPGEGGPGIFFTDKSQWDRSASQLSNALVDIILLSKCSGLLGSPWSSFTELASRLTEVPGYKVRLAGTDFGTTKYGVLCYPGTLNLGDDIQSIAAEGLLPRVDYIVDRDHQGTILNTSGKPVGPDDTGKPVRILENGWFDGRFVEFIPSPRLDPLFISFHLNEDPKLFSDPRYDVHSDASTKPQRLLQNPSFTSYVSRYGPVGTRDARTMLMFNEANVAAYYSCCLTLTLFYTYSPIPVSQRQKRYWWSTPILTPRTTR